MYRATRWTAVATLLATLLMAGTTLAQLIPVFEYRFPESYDGTNLTLTDQSTAGNHGVMDNVSGYLADDRPEGFATGGSITGTYGGTGVTNATQLLTNALVQAHGGFTLDTWFWADPAQTGIAKLIDYAGTEALRLRVEGTGACNLDLTIYQTTSGGSTYLTTPIETGRWYHAIGQFDPLNYAVNGSGNLTGRLSLVLDDQTVATAIRTKGAFGDTLNRTMALNRWTQSATTDVNLGKLYNPSCYLGADASIVEVPEPRLVGYWPLDDVISPASQPGRRTADLSGDSVHGTYQRGLEAGYASVKPEFGTCPKFDGVDDEVYLGNSLGMLQADFTIAAWINPTNVGDGAPATQRIFSSSASTSGTGFGFAIASENRLKFTTFGVQDYFISVPDGFQQDAWQHVAVAFNSDSQATFYFNGQRLGTVDGPYAARYTTDNFFIGRTGIAEPFQGMIDEVAVWSGVLSDSDVAALAGGAKPSTLYASYPRVNPYAADNHTALLYHLNSASGDYSRDATDVFIADASGHAQHMQTEIGASTYSPFTSAGSPMGLGTAASPAPTAAQRVFRGNAKLDLLSTSEFTIEAWIRNPLEAGTGGIFWAGHMGVFSDYDKVVRFAVTGLGDQLQLSFIDASGIMVSYTSTASLSFDADTWYHVAVTYEGDGSGNDSLVRFFANAFGEETPAQLGLDISANDVLAFASGEIGTIGIGEWMPFSGDFGGNIDEVRWSNVARGEFNLTVTAPETFHPGDANGDGKVDDLDASILAANWQRTGDATWSTADFNADGNVNDLDASILAANWQYGVGSAIPEPGTLGLLTGGIILLLRSRRKGLDNHARF